MGAGTAAAEQPAQAALPAAFGQPAEGAERAGRAVVADFLSKVPYPCLAVTALGLAPTWMFGPLAAGDGCCQCMPYLAFWLRASRSCGTYM